jgi:polar amino acid transport system permease protein
MGLPAYVKRQRQAPILSPANGVRVVEMVVGGLLVISLFELALHYDIRDPNLWARYGISFVRGFWGTLGYIALVLPVSVALGFGAGWARVSRHRLLSWPSAAYIDFFRGIPLIVAILFAFLYGVDFIPERIRFFLEDALGISASSLPYAMAALALAAHSGAYQAEIFRAGFQSIPRGQVEAAEALGLRHFQSMTSVILPQTFRLSLPPLGNELAVLIKDTSVLGAFGASELVGLASEFTQQIPISGGQLVWQFAIWTAIALTYFVMTFLVTRVLHLLERRFRTPGLEVVSL